MSFFNINIQSIQTHLVSQILVTGATGLIGSRLVEMLLENGHEVTSLVRESNKANKKSKVIQGDLTQKDWDVKENFDYVIHLASHTPLERNKKILELVNLNGTKNLFEKVKGRTKNIIYISGMGVYGNTYGKTIDESFEYKADTDFVRIRLDAQRFLKESCHANNIGFIVIHFGDVYGEKGWFYEMLISRLLKNTFRLPSGGNYEKGFVHIDDAAGSIISIVEQNKKNETYIVVDSLPTSFKDFVDYTAELIKVKKPGNVPSFLVKAVLGAELVKLLTTPTIASNKKITELYNFKFPTYRQGIPDIIDRLKRSGKLTKS